MSKYIQVTGIIAIVVSAFTIISAGHTNLSLRSDLKQLTQLNDDMRMRIAELREEVAGLQSKRGAEHAARDVLGMARPGELTIVLE